MLTASPIDASNIARVIPLYQAFSAVAADNYGWTIPPIEPEAMAGAIIAGHVRGLVVDTPASAESQELPAGFMLYFVEDHRAIELQVVYDHELDSRRISRKAFLDTLMRAFLLDIGPLQGWDTVSWAMLGRQGADYIRTVTWYGFEPVGQAIVKFDMTDPLTVQLYQQAPQVTLPEGHVIAPWRQELAGGACETIYEAFHTATDANWDPRFRNIPGARRAVGQITAGIFGRFLSECTQLLVDHRGPEPVVNGVCFLIAGGGPLEANVPLIGVRPSHKRQKLGQALLHASIGAAIQQILAEKLDAMAITATLDTDNISAIGMYRRLGFRETDNYPHVYLTRERYDNQVTHILSGQWCNDPGGLVDNHV